jgi:hypothetical protein
MAVLSSRVSPNAIYTGALLSYWDGHGVEEIRGQHYRLT